MNRKIISFAIAFLLCVGLCSAGFAAWVITAPATKTADGAIEVEAVQDDRLNIEVTSNPAQAKIVYGPRATTLEHSWLKADKDTEALKVTFTVVVTKKSGGIFTNEMPEVTLSAIKGEGVDASTEYGNMVSAKYIAALPQKVESFTGNEAGITVGKTLSNANKTATYTIVVQFAWGEMYGGNNPYVFYNSNPANETVPTTQLTYADHAAKHLKALQDGLNDIRFRLTVSFN